MESHLVEVTSQEQMDYLTLEMSIRDSDTGYWSVWWLWITINAFLKVEWGNRHRSWRFMVLDPQPHPRIGASLGAWQTLWIYWVKLPLFLWGLRIPGSWLCQWQLFCCSHLSEDLSCRYQSSLFWFTEDLTMKLDFYVILKGCMMCVSDWTFKD